MTNEYLNTAAKAIGGTAGYVSKGARTLEEKLEQNAGKMIVIGAACAVLGGAFYFLRKRAQTVQRRMEVVLEDYLPQEERLASPTRMLAIPITTTSRKEGELIAGYIRKVHASLEHVQGKTELLSFIGAQGAHDDETLFRRWREFRMLPTEAYDRYSARKIRAD